MEETNISEKDGKKAARAAKKEQKRLEKEQKRRKKQEKQRRLLFPADKKGRHVMHFMNVLRVIFYPIHALIFPFKLHGYKKVGKGAYIYVCNHYSLLDVFFPAHTTWEGVHFIAKEEVMHAPVLGYVARRVGVIGAARDGSDVRSIMDSLKVLKNGEKIVIFPEGTRNRKPGDEFLPFHGGAAMLAIKSRTPVIPLVICDRPRPFRRVHVMIGEPMELSDYYGRKLTPEEYGEADKLLENRLYELRDEFRASRRKKGAEKR